MIVRFTKAPPAAQADSVCCLRDDRTTCTQPMPRQGILPRAAVHFVIETTLGWADAIYGQIARGACLADLAGVTGAPELKRTKSPPSAVLQSHALADCLQADQWGGASDPATFTLNLANACRRLGAPTPEISAQQLEPVRVGLREFGAHWRPLGAGATFERTFAL